VGRRERKKKKKEEEENGAEKLHCHFSKSDDPFPFKG
jgi:hypothetical protein